MKDNLICLAITVATVTVAIAVGGFFAKYAPGAIPDAVAYPLMAVLLTLSALPTRSAREDS